MSIWADAATIVTRTLSGDIDFQVVNAYKSGAAWLVFAPFTILGGLLICYLYKRVPWLERNLERTIVVWSYIVMAAIIFFGVIQRFLLSGQPAWSTTIPPLIFMIMAWYGCSFNVRLRTHLSFNEFRTKFSPTGQIAALSLDAVLWLVFCVVIVTTVSREVVRSYSNFQIVLGTDNTMQWWFLITIPVAFILMAARVLENFFEDWRNFRSKNTLIKQAVIGGDV
jgi:TRAP-type C4-dicarboxylate transport system permease small subunit